MKKTILPLLLLCTITFSNSCDEDGSLDLECIADLAVTALEAPASVIAGDVVDIICTIRNFITDVDRCGDAEEGFVSVTCGYSPTPKNSFSEYDPIESYTLPLAAISEGAVVIDPETMKMPTNLGPGSYAMRVSAESPNDDNPGNNAFAVRVEAN